MGLQGGHGESTLITAHGDYMVRGKVAEFGRRVAGSVASLDCLLKNTPVRF